jgi:beta-glucosidase
MLAMTASHHALLAHGRAVPIIRANVPDAQVGITLNLSHVDPATPTSADLAAAARFDGYLNRFYLDPVLRGHYPQDMMQMYGFFMPPIEPGDMETINVPTDFLGVNYYNRTVVADEPEQIGLQIRTVQPEGEYTAMDWEVYPQGLFSLLMRLHEEYGVKAIYITENGAAFDDTLNPDGTIHDERRVAYLRGHFEAASHAIRDGVPLKGYFVWSLLDNFEWAEGYAKRFGVVYVDYATQQRYVKDSGKLLAQVATETKGEEV